MHALTDEQIDAMEAGPEMDRAVNEAAGIAVENWSVPSNDWTHAMFAAERFGLFEIVGGNGYVLDCVRGEWRVSCWASPAIPTNTPVPGPLAICRAILKLARKATACSTP